MCRRGFNHDRCLIPLDDIQFLGALVSSAGDKIMSQARLDCPAIFDVYF